MYRKTPAWQRVMGYQDTDNEKIGCREKFLQLIFYLKMFLHKKHLTNKSYKCNIKENYVIAWEVRHE